MEVLCWRGGDVVFEGLISFCFCVLEYLYFLFVFFGKSPENEFPISHFSFCVLT